MDLDELLASFKDVLESRSVSQALSRDGYLTSRVFKAELRRKLEAGELELEIQNERDFAIIRNGEMVSGSIDRLVLLRGPSGVVAADIIDFKTDQATTQKQLKQLKGVYAEQLGVYREAVSLMFGLDQKSISARLLMTEAGVVMDVGPV